MKCSIIFNVLPKSFKEVDTVIEIEKSEFGRVGVGKKPLGFLPTPSLPIEKSEFEFRRVGVGKKPLGFLPTPSMKLKKVNLGELG